MTAIPTTTATSAERQLAALRDHRFAALRDHYEADGPDGSVPGASRSGRWAIVTEDEGHRFINRADSRALAADVAAESVSSSSGPLCLHNLDDLAGPEPLIEEGDIVRVVDPAARQAAGAVGPVEVMSIDHKNGERTLNLPRGKWCFAYEAEIVERADPDARLPVRYDVAQVSVPVVFNTAQS